MVRKLGLLGVRDVNAALSFHLRYDGSGVGVFVDGPGESINIPSTLYSDGQTMPLNHFCSRQRSFICNFVDELIAQCFSPLSGPSAEAAGRCSHGVLTQDQERDSVTTIQEYLSIGRIVEHQIVRVSIKNCRRLFHKAVSPSSCETNQRRTLTGYS
jgi:hypothetical protein